MEGLGPICAQVAHFLSSATPIPPKTVAKTPEKPDEQVPNPDYDVWIVKDQ